MGAPRVQGSNHGTAFATAGLAEKPPAVVLLSGGLDSATVLYWALSRGWEPLALSFDYGQRHRVELQRAAAGRTGA